MRIIGNAHLTFEEFNKLLAQIEVFLSSRPLWNLSNDPSDIQALTTGQFLIYSRLISFPEDDVSHITPKTDYLYDKDYHI